MTRTPVEVRYCLMIDGDTAPIVTYPRDPWGAYAWIAALDAAVRSVHGPAVELFVGDRYLARYSHGRRAARLPAALVPAARRG